MVLLAMESRKSRAKMPHNFRTEFLTSQATLPMATIRRLSDLDVRAIFEAVHNNTPPPAQLEFQIVPVGPDGLKLSPPSHEFEDGLYVLLKPQKKKQQFGNSIDHSMVPSSLMHMVIGNLPDAICPWSLSGPQFPHPTAIQQRYCYPKGDPEYSSQKGGALWTMYGTDGKEDLEYRLLHVYFSAKRATNKYVKESPVSARRGAKKASLRKARRGNAMDSMPPLLPPQIEVSPDIFSNHFGERSSREFVMSGDPFMEPLLDMDLDDVTASPERPLPLLDPFSFGMEELNEEFSEMEQPHDHVQAFEIKLREMHSCLKDSILFSAPQADQGHMISMLTAWAKQVAASPLGKVQAMEGVENVEGV